MQSRTAAPDNTRWSFWLLTAMTGCFCAFVLSLPLFPTEDGPIHLYYATILGDLLRHSSPLYAQYYVVRHLMPPYSLHYYLLIVLMKLVSAKLAEKLLVCLVLVNFAYGFRYLAMGIGEAGHVFSLLVVALLFNWPLGMGFENFSLAVGIACWTLGVWTRLQKPTCVRRQHYRIGFVLLIALMTVTHPVPMVLTLGFAALDFVLRTVAESTWKTAKWGRKRTAADLFTLLAGASSLLYIGHFTDRGRVAAEAHQASLPLAEFAHYAELFGMAFFGGATAGAKLYRLALYFVLCIGLFLGTSATVKQLRHKEWSPQLTWAAATLLLIPGICLLPPDINGSHFFAARLVVFVWIAAICAASGYPQLSQAGVSGITAASVLIAALVLGMSQLCLRPAARQLAELETLPMAHRGEAGVLLPANQQAYDFKQALAFYPGLWIGVDYFRRSGSVLLNSPWMDLPILPLGARPGLLTASVPAAQLENYQALREALLNSPPAFAAILPRVDFLFISGPGSRIDPSVMNPLLGASRPPFVCSGQSWFVLCHR